TPPDTEAAQTARRFCAGLLRSRLELPPYSLFSFIGLTLGYNQSELATADKLATRISQQTRQEPTLGAIVDAIQEIVGSERFEGVDTEDAESQYSRGGQLTVITMHKAKGLDWDGVFLPFLHSRSLPGELWVSPAGEFIGNFTLAEVARAQIRSHAHQGGPQSIPDTVSAWQQAKQLKIAEEYRLLYVAMTRAKRLLWMSAAQQAPFTWNKPESLQNQEPSPAITALKRHRLA
ncbi:DNA helicase UvrD, partial [filamentous cyanobacterium CCP5]